MNRARQIFNSSFFIFHQQSLQLRKLTSIMSRVVLKTRYRNFFTCCLRSNCCDISITKESLQKALDETIPNNCLMNKIGREAALSFVMEEYDTFKNADSFNVPSALTSEMLEELIRIESRSQRIKYHKHSFCLERRRENRLRKRQELLQQEVIVPEPKKDENCFSSHLIPAVRKVHVKRWEDLRLAYADLLGPKFVVDVDYDAYMIRKEIRNSIQQVSLIISENRHNRHPFDLYICNAKAKNYSKHCIDAFIPDVNSGKRFETFTESSYLDIFPKEKLVYLSPHAKEPLQEYNSDNIYIIGAFVDLSSGQPISQIKAEHEGIRTCSLPLDKYIMWGYGSKCLSINQAFGIMLSLKNTGDWQKAMDKVPRRKIKKLDAELVQNEPLTSEKKFLIDTRKKNVEMSE